MKRHLAVRVSTLKRAPAFDEVTTACGRIFSGYDDKKLFARWTRRPESATCLLCKKRVKPARGAGEVMSWEIDGESWPYTKLRERAARADDLAKRVEELEGLLRAWGDAEAAWLVAARMRVVYAEATRLAKEKP